MGAWGKKWRKRIIFLFFFNWERKLQIQFLPYASHSYDFLQFLPLFIISSSTLGTVLDFFSSISGKVSLLSYLYFVRVTSSFFLLSFSYQASSSSFLIINLVCYNLAMDLLRGWVLTSVMAGRCKRQGSMKYPWWRVVYNVLWQRHDISFINMRTTWHLYVLYSSSLHLWFSVIVSESVFIN